MPSQRVLPCCYHSVLLRLLALLLHALVTASGIFAPAVTRVCNRRSFRPPCFCKHFIVTFQEAFGCMRSTSTSHGQGRLGTWQGSLTHHNMSCPSLLCLWTAVTAKGHMQALPSVVPAIQRQSSPHASLRYMCECHRPLFPKISFQSDNAHELPPSIVNRGILFQITLL